MSSFVELSPELVFLVVDESQTIRDILFTTLKKMGLTKIVQAMDSVRALQLLKEQQIDFIICDRNFRNMSGMEFLKELRETPEIARVPFMMMASEIPKEDVLLASELGVDAYLKKPFVMKDVSTRLSACMAKFNTPGTAEAVFEEARLAFVRGAHKEAIEKYERLKEALPTSARVRVGLARCHRACRDNKTAITILQEAIEKNPIYVHAHHELGLAYMQEKMLESALRCFSKAIDLSPSNPARYESVADILIRNEKPREAEEYLMRAVKLELVYPVLYEQLGKVLFAQKKVDRAYQYFEKALREQPDNVSFLNSMGICMKEMGRYEEAVNYYNGALKHRSQDVKIMFNKLLCLVELNQIDRAIKTCQSILKIDPNYEKATRKLAQLTQTQSGTSATPTTNANSKPASATASPQPANSAKKDPSGGNGSAA